VGDWSVLATAAVGIVGIAAAFFAPTWSERAIGRRQRERDFRVAKRLVAHELARLEAHLHVLSQSGVIEPEIVGLLESPEWDAHKTTLALSLPGEVWRALGHIYATVEGLRTVLALGRGEPVSDGQRNILAAVVKLVGGASGALERIKAEQA